MNEDSRMTLGGLAGLVAIGLLVLATLFGLWHAFKAFGRYQRLADARNEVTVNNIKIDQTKQLVDIERQQAEIRIVEAQGIAESQKIINATLTDKYLQHEAIEAQRKMAESPNHTTIYIPSGQNGIPLVKTLDEK